MNYIKQYLKELLMGKKEQKPNRPYSAHEEFAKKDKCKPCGCANCTNPPHKDICDEGCCCCCS